MNRRSWLGGAAGALVSLAFARAGVAAAAAPVDVPGEEPAPPPPDPTVLAPLLPPFKAALLEQNPESAGWEALRLSPSGRYLLAEVRAGRRQSVQLLDPDGKLIRDLTADRFTSARGLWGATDQQLLLECRAEGSPRPRHLKYNPASEGSAPAVVPGMPEWAPGGKDYLLALAAAERGSDEPVAFQRYTVANDPVGRPLPVEDPVWSADGQWLAFLGRPAAPADNGVSAPQLLEVRVLPARGDVPRVVVSHGGWERLSRENGWSDAAGPESLTWSPAGDALLGLCSARTEHGEELFLVRMDLRTARREVLSIPAKTEILTTSADARHWVIRLQDRLFRLDFEVPPAKKRTPSAAGTLRSKIG